MSRTNPRLESQYERDLRIPLRIVVAGVSTTLPLGTVASTDLLADKPVGAKLFRGDVELARKWGSTGPVSVSASGVPAHVWRSRAYRERRSGVVGKQP